MPESTGKEKNEIATETSSSTETSATTNNVNVDVVADANGYVHVYTGNGKGKSTAAFGLAIRALMAGRKVFIGQFVKSMKYNETKIVQALIPAGFAERQLRIEQFGNGCFVYKHDPTQQDVDMAVEGFEECERILSVNDGCDNEYDVVVLDEITIALKYKLLDVERVVRAIQNRNPSIEVVVTGRYAPQELIEIGDVVTEMKEIKHYFKSKGVLAREGIER